LSECPIAFPPITKAFEERPEDQDPPTKRFFLPWHQSRDMEQLRHHRQQHKNEEEFLPIVNVLSESCCEEEVKKEATIRKDSDYIPLRQATNPCDFER
jgi:hypothetical protein